MLANDEAQLIAHIVNKYDCTRCNQSYKPDKILKLEDSKIKQQENLNANSVKAEGAITDACMPAANVIFITAIIKSAEQRRVAKLREAIFNYPMLECS
jgi:hypothetical protein